MIPSIHTQRLVLVAATLEHIVTELEDPSRLGPLIGARVPEGWPGEYDRDVHRVVAETDASNSASQRVLERNGFARAGRGREATSVRYEKARPSSNE